MISCSCASRNRQSWIAIAALGLLFLASTPETASAFYRNLRVVPDQPLAGQPYRFLVDFGQCDLVSPLFPPLVRSYSVTGRVVSIEVRASDQNDFPFNCNFFSGTATIEMPPLPPGRWRLDFYRWDQAQIIDVQLRGSVEFDVVAAPVPIGGGLPIALLTLVVGAAGAIRLRGRANSSK